MSQPWPGHPADRAFPEPQLPWEVAYELDFTRLRTLTLSGASAVIGDRTWVVANAANADTLRIANGTGIEIVPSDDTAYPTGTNAAPYLEIALEDVVSGYERPDRVVVQARVSSSGLAADTQQYGVMVGSGSNVNKHYVGRLGVAHSGTSPNHLKARCTRQSSPPYAYDAALSAEPTLLSVEWRPPATELRYGSGSPWLWPDEMTVAAYAFPLIALAPSTSEGQFSASTDVLRLWAERNPTGIASFTARFEAIRVLCQRY